MHDRFTSLTILGVIDTADPEEQRALDGLVIMDVGAAQRLLGMVGRLTRVDLILERDEAARVERLLPAGARLAPASEQAGATAQLTAAFSLNLTALSLLALLVGMFLIYNTVLFSVVQRRAVFGTLRALGVTGGQTFTLILVETAVTSALGALLGVGLGWVLGQGAVRLVTRTINDLYFVLSVRDAPLTLAAALQGMALGIGAGLLAALAPALEASRVEPVVALRPSTLEGKHAAAPALGVARGPPAGRAGRRGAPGRCRDPWSMSFAGLFAIVLGLALVAPVLDGRCSWQRRGRSRPAFVGTLGRLAARTVTRSISRTGVAIASLMIAVSVTIGVSLMIQSFRATVENWLDLSLRADIFIAAPGAATARPVLSLRRAGARGRGARSGGAGDVPRGDGVEPARRRPARGRRPRGASAAPPSTVSRRAARPTCGSACWTGAVIVSEPFAFRHDIPPHGGYGDACSPTAGRGRSPWPASSTTTRPSAALVLHVAQRLRALLGRPGDRLPRRHRGPWRSRSTRSRTGSAPPSREPPSR